jgi:hypothetical protein
MKKQVLRTYVIVVFLTLFANYGTNGVLHAEPTPANTVTCYCTLGVEEPWLTQWTVYDCGPCTKVITSFKDDQLHCVYNGSTTNGYIPEI